jgi:cupin superfamily acireductone dioxygenase involved in methionine salvage
LLAPNSARVSGAQQITAAETKISNYLKTWEVSLAEFKKLTSTAKQEHIQFLLTLQIEELSTNDEYILRWFGPASKSNVENFIHL